MINAEKFKEEILAVKNKGDDFTLDKDNQIICCQDLGCENCVFNNDVGCSYSRMDWLLSEYKESTKVTRLEYELLKYWDGKRYKYIARDRDGALYIYRDKPSKNEDVWGTLYGHARLMKYFDDLFWFVKWEDKEPIEIKEVLENCKAFDDD